ncbi:hypothetical protein [Roseateles sp.]|uniref:hypothetical protein n=1 Tax=Roseateles sp. TaxID=1971397 RepID=UPI002F41AF96
MRWVLVASPLIWLISPLRHAVEASMFAHMVLQLPLLVLAGLIAGRQLPDPIARRIAAVDAFGLTSVLAVIATSFAWMIPAALDLALLSPAVDLLKHVSLWVSGFLLGTALRRLTLGVETFLLGNVGWMLATAGLLYMDATSRLCVNYLFDEQRAAGVGLMAMAVLLGLRLMLRWHGAASDGAAATAPGPSTDRRLPAAPASFDGDQSRS